MGEGNNRYSEFVEGTAGAINDPFLKSTNNQFDWWLPFISGFK